MLSLTYRVENTSLYRFRFYDTTFLHGIFECFLKGSVWTETIHVIWMEMGIQVRRLYLKNVLIRTEQFLQGAQIIDYTSQGNIILIKTVNKTVLIWFKFHTMAAFECF